MTAFVLFAVATAAGCGRGKGPVGDSGGEDPHVGICDDYPNSPWEGGKEEGDPLLNYPSVRYGDVVIRSCRRDLQSHRAQVFHDPHKGAGAAELVVSDSFYSVGEDGIQNAVKNNALAGAYLVASLEHAVGSEYLVVEDELESQVVPDHGGERLGKYFIKPTDLDFDGLPDHVIGSGGGDVDLSDWEAGIGTRDVGLWVLYGPVSGDVVADDEATTVSLAWSEEETSQRSYWYAIPTIVGDVTGDTYPDIALPLESGGAGEVVLIPGPITEDIHLEDWGLSVTGGQYPGNGAVTVLDGFDADADGVNDLGLSYRSTDAGDDSGVRFFFGPITESRSAEDQDAFLGDLRHNQEDENTPHYNSYRWGEPIKTAGDLDGDGYEDIAVHSERDYRDVVDGGIVWLVHGPVQGTLDIEEVAAARVYGSVSHQNIGIHLGTGGDLDGDGHLDLVLGSTGSTKYQSVADAGTWLHWGPFEGTIDNADGIEIHAQRGLDVAMDEDLDGDGIDDLVMADAELEDDDWWLDEPTMGGGMHIWLSTRSMEWPRPWAPVR